MTGSRASVIALALLSGACDADAPSAVPSPSAAVGTPIEIRLTAAQGLPPFDIQATFDRNLDPGPHVQPVTAALAAARQACFANGAPIAPSTKIALRLVVHAKHGHAEARDPAGACLAHALDGTAIDDPLDYAIDLVVGVG